MTPDPRMHRLGSALPELARGRHRWRRYGASFMELVSYVAGERWSDHPRCTHPVLAALARAVNDATSDAARPLLAPLVPAVIGLDGDNEQWSIEIAVLAASGALPVVGPARQQALAVGLLACDRALERMDDRDPGSATARVLAALDAAPAAEAWARGFVMRSGLDVERFTSSAAPEIVRLAVEGIALAGLADADSRLRDLLHDAILECRTWAGLDPLPVRELDPGLWLAVCRPWSVAG